VLYSCTQRRAAAALHLKANNSCCTSFVDARELLDLIGDQQLLQAAEEVGLEEERADGLVTFLRTLTKFRPLGEKTLSPVAKLGLPSYVFENAPSLPPRRMLAKLKFQKLKSRYSGSPVFKVTENSKFFQLLPIAQTVFNDHFTSAQRLIFKRPGYLVSIVAIHISIASNRFDSRLQHTSAA
jgi:hypothetical protein